MELNIAPISSAPSPARLGGGGKKPQKGGWKKRRKEELIQRARSQKRQRTSVGDKRKAAASAIQVDEFASGGIEEEPQRPSKDVHGTLKGGKVSFKSNPKSQKDDPGLKKLPNVVVEGRKQTFSLSKEPSLTQKRQNNPTQGRPRPEKKDDQRPEAVSAALAIVGNPAPDSNSPEEVAGKAANAADNSAKADAGKTEENETFGATSFEKTGLYRSVALHMVHRLNLAVPTKIQEKVLNVLLNLEEGQQSVDVLVRSATGSGKTLAYLLPIAHYLLNRSKRVTREDGSLAIIVVPTRELADQVEEVAQMLFRSWHWIVVGAVRGGETKRREKARLRKGINVLVATPGRLLDHMRNTMSFSYGFCEFLVLDEADRLLDLGFEAEVKEAIQNLDKQAAAMNPDAGKIRSNILLSATLRNDVKKLAEFSLEKPVEITVGDREGQSGSAFSMPSQLRQHYCIVEQRYRLVALACFLRLRALKGAAAQKTTGVDRIEPPCKVIVFFSTCDSVDFHYNLLRKAKLPKELDEDGKATGKKLLPLQLYRIHGNLEQSQRDDSLAQFRRSQRAVLFCTDVAARGLDLKGLTFSVQYDPPTGGQGEELEYLHRAGRTARIGGKGDALLFLLPSERAYIGKLESKGVSIAEISGSAGMAAMYPRVDLKNQDSISYGTRLVTSGLQESLEEMVKNDGELKRQAVAGFQAYCRAYATHAKEVRYFFHVRNLHLGHVARAFVLGDKPAELGEIIAELKAAKKKSEQEEGSSKSKKNDRETTSKREIARAIAEGERQPYNDQKTTLAKRRREKGSGQEALKELAMEFDS